VTEKEIVAESTIGSTHVREPHKLQRRVKTMKKLRKQPTSQVNRSIGTTLLSTKHE